MSEDKGQLIIYQSEDGQAQVSAKMHDETIWLTQDAMAQLFESTKQNISLHIINVLEEQELEKTSTVKDFLTVQKEGSRNVSRNLTYYNLDMIIAVGYRVKSKIATKFRVWANNVLKEYLTKGYVINEKLLATQKEKITALQTTVSLLSRSMANQIETVEDAQNVTKILDKFAKGLDLLDDFDHETLDTKGQTSKEAVMISTEEFLKVVNEMKSEFESDVFANPKDESFDSSVNQIYQTYGGNDCYPTLEEKASMLLYFIVKNHSFTDGNKRIGASCFLYFLNKNNMLYKDNENLIIDNGTLFALTILIAESDPIEMETIKQIVVSVLNRS